MDPGNWATDLEGGARFGYQLLWVLVVSNLIAILLQTLAARLGVAGGRDLAQACREAYPRPVAVMLWLICEIAIAAMDLAELLGAAIGLKLLFGIPLIAGIVITAADTLLILLLTRFGIRTLEAVIVALISTIGICMAAELVLAKPAFGAVLSGLRPALNGESVYVAIGILGATVMPHNLYLHSALVQTRRFGAEKRLALHSNLIDSVVALNLALFVNAAILVLAASVFHANGVVVTEIEQAHQLLAPLMGTAAASVLFALALLAAGQSSTITGTMAGQIVMEGFLNFRMSPWLRRFVTRLVALVPAVLTVLYAGESGSYQLLILSQVILSLQLPFAIVPLIHFTSDQARMGEFANRLWVRVLAWTAVALIVGLNLWLVFQKLTEWSSAGPAMVLVWLPVTALMLLLAWITFRPMLPEWAQARVSVGFSLETEGWDSLPIEAAPERYRSILVPLDHSPMDRYCLKESAGLAQQHQAKLYLLHVEEGVTSQVYGSLSTTAEVAAGRDYLERVRQRLQETGVEAEVLIRHGRQPAQQIVKVVEEMTPDLVVMGAHGHAGFKDFVFGNTINRVRHQIRKPLLIVRRPEE
jgi:manganese transport protein